jgi:predicted alpha/beta superfamily hydrolase
MVPATAIALASCAGGPRPPRDGAAAAGAADLHPAPSPVELSVTVTVPSSTPPDASLFLASNAGSWNPGDPGWRLQRAPDGTFRGVFGVEPGSLFEFKVTRGSWENVEKGPRGAPFANRAYQVPGAAGQAASLEIAVASWSDLVASSAGSRVLGRLDQVKDFPMSGLGRSRTIRIWLPVDLGKDGRRHPVLYLQDGQNLFDAATSFAGEWGIDEALSALATGPGSPGDWIVVGVDNGGSERLAEYSPFVDPRIRDPLGEAYVDFLADELKPWVDSNYPTLAGRGHTAIGGSSMGGLISLYAAWRRPETFSRVLCMSSAFWIGGNALRALIAERGIPPGLRVYLDVGGAEGGLPAERDAMVRDSRDMAETLRAAGLPEGDLRLIVDPAAAHNEAAWARRFPAAWEWLAGEAR